MGCGASLVPPVFEAKSLHAEASFFPGVNSTTPDKTKPHENGISSGSSSIGRGSTDKSNDSPPPRVVSDGKGSTELQDCDNGETSVVGTRGGIMKGRGDDSYVGQTRSASPVPGLSDYATLSLHHVHKKLKHNHRVFRICLTGGPCAGKSTFLTQLQTKMAQRTGYKVYCVTEAATLLVTGGMEWDGELIEDQQLALLRVQIALEDQFYSLALASGKPSIVISDRGTMDGRAFCSDEIFARILRRLNVTLETLRDRYDAVIHLVTAAAGASEYYNLDNSARYENVEEAVLSDTKLRQVYLGHPMLRIIDNSTTFKEKIERGMTLVGQIIGQKFSMQNTTYYLVCDCPKVLPVKYATCTLTTTILCNSHLDDIRLLIKREYASGECMYFFNSIRGGNGKGSSSREDGRKADGSVTRDSSPIQQGGLDAIQNAFFSPESGQRIKNEQRISSKEYASLIRHRDAQRRDVVLHALLFIHNDNRYEVTTIVEPSWAAGKQAMTLECDDHLKATFPAFIKVDREVPIDSLSTAFLISHSEMGPLYTSLAYAPVFTRGVVVNRVRTKAAGAGKGGSQYLSISETGGAVKKRRKKSTKIDAASNSDALFSAPQEQREKEPVSQHRDLNAVANTTSTKDTEEVTVNAKPSENIKVSVTAVEMHKTTESFSEEKQQLLRTNSRLLPLEGQPPPPTGPPTANPRGMINNHHK